MIMFSSRILSILKSEEKSLILLSATKTMSSLCEAFKCEAILCLNSCASKAWTWKAHFRQTPKYNIAKPLTSVSSGLEKRLSELVSNFKGFILLQSVLFSLFLPLLKPKPILRNVLGFFYPEITDITAFLDKSHKNIKNNGRIFAQPKPKRQFFAKFSDVGFASH